MIARTLGLLACLVLAAPAQAGLISVRPFDDPATLGLFIPISDFPPGAVVPPDKLVTNQYAAIGVLFDGVAYGMIHAIPVWLPTGSSFGPPGFPDPLAGQLNFRPGYNAVIGGSFVMPGTAQPTSVSSVTVTFMGGEPGTAAAVFFDSNGQWLGNPTQFNAGESIVEGPGGSATLTFAHPDIARFELYRTFTLTSDWGDPVPWGIASITAEVPSAVATPEPATLALAAAGLLAGGLVRRRSFRV